MIRLENVSKKYAFDDRETAVLAGIDLSIQHGEIFGIVGETGSGKSTILRLMNGFIEPDGGSIFLMGEKLDRQSRHTLVKHTSMIFQSFNLLHNLNVLENVVLPATLRKENKQASRQRAAELLRFVGLADQAKSPIKHLSGGGKQRVAIARTLMTNPKLIFCDEPTSALDEKMTFEILQLLRDINTQFGTTIVLVSHDIAVIKALCHRVAIIEEGRVSDIIERKPAALTPLSYKEALTS